MSVFKKIQASNLQFYYGLDLESKQAINVTEIVLQKCVQPDGTIVVDQNKNFLFGDTFPNIVKTFFCVYENIVIKKVSEYIDFMIKSDFILYTEELSTIILKEYENDYSTLFCTPDTKFFIGPDLDQLSDITNLTIESYSKPDKTIQIPSGYKIWDNENQLDNFIFIKTSKYLHKVKGSASVSIGNKSPKNVIISCMSNFNKNSGGVTCCYKMAHSMDNVSEGWVKIHGETNPIHDKIWNGEPFDKENTVVVYTELIYGNPLGAKYVVRWILAPLGTFNNSNHYLNYDRNDLVYYFNLEERFYKKDDKIFKLLSIINIPSVQFNSFTRPLNYCHMWRKCNIHASISPIHPANSTELGKDLDLNETLKAFQNFEYFICYDPLSFFLILAAMSGCISILYPLQGMSKKDWYKTTCVNNYLEEKNIDLYGIAYGNSQEEIEWARSTLHLVTDQWNDMESYMKAKTIVPFLEDIANFDCQLNTVQNNYY